MALEMNERIHLSRQRTCLTVLTSYHLACQVESQSVLEVVAVLIPLMRCDSCLSYSTFLILGIPDPF
jgi:hypothetical protein